MIKTCYAFVECSLEDSSGNDSRHIERETVLQHGT